MNNPWFRMYAEFRSDPKIQTLSESMQRRFVMLLCLKCEGELEKLTEKEIAFALNLSELKFSQTKHKLIQKKLVNVSSGVFQITNWDKRQYVSDTSTDRVKKHREKKANETFQKRYCNGDVTPPDTDTDTDTDTEAKIPLLSPKGESIENPEIPVNSPKKLARDYKSESQEVINYFQQKSGKRNKETKEILARLKEGGTVEDCKHIIDVKWNDPFFIDTPKYFNPETLFRKKHWDTYLNETEADYSPRASVPSEPEPDSAFHRID